MGAHNTVAKLTKYFRVAQPTMHPPPLNDF